MDKIKVGVIGVGHLGQHHARIYAGMDGVDLAVICDIDFRRAKKLAKKYRTTAFTDYKQMFGVVNCVSVVVPTVERGFAPALLCSMEIAGDMPSICSTFGFSSCSKNWRAYAERLSTYLRWPSAYIVSKAREDFPEPLRPVTTISLLRGILTLIFLRLCSFAPIILINCSSITDNNLYN